MQLIHANGQPEAQPTFPAREFETLQELADKNAPVRSKPEPAASHNTAGSVMEPTPIPVVPPQRMVRTKKRKSYPKLPEQLSLFSSDDDPLTAFQAVGFTCVDNREKSDILWVLYDGDRAEVFHEIERRYMLKASLERRGAVSTNYAPAWRIQMKR